MIKPETVTQIYDAVRIEEVVGDFVQLRKRGTSLIGLCPFHNEKTPSFHVSVTKGIYKCFGCGKGGDSAGFIMEHEKASYPEALRYLAQKYQIELEETEPDPNQIIQNDDRESLLVLNSWAKAWFTNNLEVSEEGKTIGQSYFKERGFRDESLRSFELGYASEQRYTLTRAALKEGFKEEFLIRSGLSIQPEQGDLYDRFRGRVIFPIQNLSGKVIGFGGRILKKDEKTAKYLNSPESEIYHKSETLYGIFQAKKAIRDQDVCLLAEGYTDVISLHQSGIQNVVASSGTSLTTQQLKLISRFTQNITILYDGDPAGIKASLRGIDMILEEGLHVRVVLFPDGQDPDSYIKSVGGAAFSTYLKAEQKDFILFKTQVLLGDAGTDPIKRSAVIHDILESIAKIPDSIEASLYTRECSRLLEIDEASLLSELNKIRLRKMKSVADSAQRKIGNNTQFQPETQSTYPDLTAGLIETEPIEPVYPDDLQEKEILRLLMNYGNAVFDPEHSVASFVFLQTEDIQFSRPAHEQFYDALKKQLGEKERLIPAEFVQHTNFNIRTLAVDLLSTPYSLSENWAEMHGIFVKTEEELLTAAIENAINHLKMRKVITLITENQQKMKNENRPERITELQSIHNLLNNLKADLSKALGVVVLK